MKAMRVHKFGLDTLMSLDEIEDARPEAGEVISNNFSVRRIQEAGGAL